MIKTNLQVILDTDRSNAGHQAIYDTGWVIFKLSMMIIEDYDTDWRLFLSYVWYWLGYTGFQASCDSDCSKASPSNYDAAWFKADI